MGSKGYCGDGSGNSPSSILLCGEIKGRKGGGFEKRMVWFGAPLQRAWRSGSCLPEVKQASEDPQCAGTSRHRHRRDGWADGNRCGRAWPPVPLVDGLGTRLHRRFEMGAIPCPVEPPEKAMKSRVIALVGRFWSEETPFLGRSGRYRRNNQKIAGKFLQKREDKSCYLGTYMVL